MRRAQLGSLQRCSSKACSSERAERVVGHDADGCWAAARRLTVIVVAQLLSELLFRSSFLRKPVCAITKDDDAWRAAASGDEATRSASSGWVCRVRYGTRGVRLANAEKLIELREVRRSVRRMRASERASEVHFPLVGLLRNRAGMR